MLTNCDICGMTYNKIKEKGDEFIPNVCSERCLIAQITKVQRKLDDRYLTWISRPRSYRSNFEEGFAKWAVKLNYPVDFEPFSFDNGKVFYIPDFFLPVQNLFVEIKGGLWEGRAYTKVKTFSKLYRIIVLTPQIFRLMKGDK